MNRRLAVVAVLCAVVLTGCKSDRETVVNPGGTGTGSREDPIRSSKVREGKWCDAPLAYGIDRDSGKLLLCQRPDGKIQMRWLPE